MNSFSWSYSWKVKTLRRPECTREKKQISFSCAKKSPKFHLGEGFKSNKSNISISQTVASSTVKRLYQPRQCHSSPKVANLVQVCQVDGDEQTSRLVKVSAKVGGHVVQRKDGAKLRQNETDEEEGLHAVDVALQQQHHHPHIYRTINKKVGEEKLCHVPVEATHKPDRLHGVDLVDVKVGPEEGVPNVEEVAEVVVALDVQIEQLCHRMHGAQCANVSESVDEDGEGDHLQKVDKDARNSIDASQNRLKVATVQRVHYLHFALHQEEVNDKNGHLKGVQRRPEDVSREDVDVVLFVGGENVEVATVPLKDNLLHQAVDRQIGAKVHLLEEVDGQRGYRAGNQTSDAFWKGQVVGAEVQQTVQLALRPQGQV